MPILLQFPKIHTLLGYHPFWFGEAKTPGDGHEVSVKAGTRKNCGWPILTLYELIYYLLTSVGRGQPVLIWPFPIIHGSEGGRYVGSYAESREF